MAENALGARLRALREKYATKLAPHLDGWKGERLGTKDRQRLHPDADRGVQTAFAIVQSIDWIPQEVLVEQTTYQLSSDQLMQLCSNLEAIVMFQTCDGLEIPLRSGFSIVSGRAKGGRNSSKWSPEVEAIARPLFENKYKGLSQNAAINRVAKDLSSRGINLSKSTIKRHLL